MASRKKVWSVMSGGVKGHSFGTWGLVKGIGVSLFTYLAAHNTQIASTELNMWRSVAPGMMGI